MSSKSGIQEYGWTAVPRNRSNVPSEAEVAQVQAAQAQQSMTSTDVDFDSIWPQTDLVRQAQEFIQAQLPQETYNHSLRVYCYGHALLSTHFPTWLSSSSSPSSFLETFALCTLYPDLATTPAHLASTHLSFEFHSAHLALTHLLSLSSPRIQAESVTEAIIRHQDPGSTGSISRIGQIIQIATELDNLGWRADLAGGKEVVESVVRKFPRMGWTGCFAGVIEREVREKPWCQTTATEGFKEMVEGNEVMNVYE